MDSEREEKQVGGIRLRNLNFILIVPALILCLLLLYTTYRARVEYSRLQEATERYIGSQQDVSEMQAASDYLTEQVRVFAVTGDPAAMDRYFEEVNVTRRRDDALEAIDKYLSGAETNEYLRQALEVSNELMQRELYAMRLAAAGFGLGDDRLAPEVLAVTLSGEDAGLTDNAQRHKARDMVFDDVYQNYKARIAENTALCSAALIDGTQVSQNASAGKVARLFSVQQLLVTALILIVCGLVLATYQLLINPLGSAGEHLRRHEELPQRGSYEMRYLARTYNDLREQNTQDRLKLSYEASHDALTGLLNRAAFEKARQQYSHENVAMMLIDVDKFKTFNDTYGHDVGDRILQKVAGLLQHSFRSDDFVCRIGGDEFAVIMLHAGKSLEGLVRGKIDALNATLGAPEDGLPPASLSVGVAFGDRDDPTDDIFKDADTALYYTKEHGRRGVSFY